MPQEKQQGYPKLKQWGISFMRRHEQKLPKKMPSNKTDRRKKKLMRRIQMMKALIQVASSVGNIEKDDDSSYSVRNSEASDGKGKEELG